MKFHNKLNLPKYIVDWLITDDYDHTDQPNTLSATTLMKPVRATVLTKKYHENLEMDVSDLIASKLGGAIHDSIEKIETENVSKEQRVSRTINIGDTTYTVTGKYDVLVKEESQWVIRDIKTTSVWAYIYSGKDADYQKQLSIYRWLLSVDRDVSEIGYIDFFFTDWQSTKAKTDNGYPQHRIKAGYPISLMSLEETENYIRTRLEQFHLYSHTSDDKLPLCTTEELWSTPEVFAVMKPGGKRATKLCDSREEAIAYMTEKDIVGQIEKRPTKARRCLYCPAKPYCGQAKSLESKGLIDY